MAENRVGIIVRSTQLFTDSMPMANLGEETFLEYLLNKISGRFKSETKVFAMAFEDLQEVSEDIIKLIENAGFHFYMGELDYLSRMIAAAKLYDIDHVVDVKVNCPLISLDTMEEMISAHLSGAADMTICQNLPQTLAPVVAGADALVRAKRLKDGGFPKYYGVESSFEKAKDYASFMVANSKCFTVSFMEGGYKWQGEVDLFSEEYATLFLQKDTLSKIRNVVYLSNKRDVTIDDVINASLIENMQTAWDQPNTFNTSYIVADQAAMSSPEGYLKEAEKETRWFVLDDQKFLDGSDIGKTSILEVGCGHGRLIRVLSKDFGQVYGTDASKERFMEARYRCNGYDNIQVTRNDGRSLSQYPDAQFNFAFAHGVFVHINSKTIITNYIKEMSRVLKPSGRLKFDCYFGGETYGISYRNFGIGGRFTEEEIQTIFDSFGIRLINIEHVVTRQFSRSGTAYSIPIKQILVVGEKI